MRSMQLIIHQNCRVIVTGFELQDPERPDGNSDWTMLYDYYAYQYGVIFANAAGNENTYVAIFGDAYNGITTGGLRLNDPNNQYEYRRVGLSSGSGPTADGRRKPDITAPSQSQTAPTSSKRYGVDNGRDNRRGNKLFGAARRGGGGAVVGAGG